MATVTFATMREPLRDEKPKPVLMALRLKVTNGRVPFAEDCHRIENGIAAASRSGARWDA